MELSEKADLNYKIDIYSSVFVFQKYKFQKFQNTYFFGEKFLFENQVGLTSCRHKSSKIKLRIYRNGKYTIKIVMTPFFRKVQTSVQFESFSNLIFSNGIIFLIPIFLIRNFVTHFLTRNCFKQNFARKSNFQEKICVKKISC